MSAASQGNTVRLSTPGLLFEECVFHSNDHTFRKRAVRAWRERRRCPSGLTALTSASHLVARARNNRFSHLRQQFLFFTTAAINLAVKIPQKTTGVIIGSVKWDKIKIPSPHYCRRKVLLLSCFPSAPTLKSRRSFQCMNNSEFTANQFLL